MFPVIQRLSGLLLLSFNLHSRKHINRSQHLYARYFIRHSRTNESNKSIRDTDENRYVARGLKVTKLLMKLKHDGPSIKQRYTRDILLGIPENKTN